MERSIRFLIIRFFSRNANSFSLSISASFAFFIVSKTVLAISFCFWPSVWRFLTCLSLILRLTWFDFISSWISLTALLLMLAPLAKALVLLSRKTSFLKSKASICFLTSFSLFRKEIASFKDCFLWFANFDSIELKAFVDLLALSEDDLICLAKSLDSIWYPKYFSALAAMSWDSLCCCLTVVKYKFSSALISLINFLLWFKESTIW